nr:MAG TPA: hypothetical protein [Caudoviricetes sp.]
MSLYIDMFFFKIIIIILFFYIDIYKKPWDIGTKP